jgi:hypothetical protein
MKLLSGWRLETDNPMLVLLMCMADTTWLLTMMPSQCCTVGYGQHMST